MKVKIPKRLQVGGHSYRIDFNSELVDRHGLDGNADHKRLFLEIRADLPPSRKMATFLHEILHAINHTYLASHLQDDDVDGIAEGLTQVLRQLNIELVDKF